MATLAQELRDDAEGSPALVVADDDDLREAFGIVLRELGFAVTCGSFETASLAALRTRGPFALAVLCVGRGLPDTMREVAELLASPALERSEVLLGTTAVVNALPVLPAASRAARVAFLRMPFELSSLDYLSQKRPAAVGQPAAQGSPRLGWDGAAAHERQPVPLDAYKLACCEVGRFLLAPALYRDEPLAKIC